MTDNVINLPSRLNAKTQDSFTFESASQPVKEAMLAGSHQPDKYCMIVFGPDDNVLSYINGMTNVQLVYIFEGLKLYFLGK